MRELSLEEMELIAGGQDTGDIVVTGSPGDWGPGDAGDFPTDGGGGGGGDYTPPPPPPPPDHPPCGASNPATIETVDGHKYDGLDGAKYYVPQNIDNNYINNVANHISDVRENGYPGQIYAELDSMYTDPSNPYFMDFKEYGTGAMPGTPDAGTQTYYSDAASQTVTSNWFEPYGNVMYGYMMTVAGYSPEETWAIAAAVQQGHTGIGIPHDDPQDQPHVDLGISIAQQYLATGQAFSPINIDSSPC